MQLIVVTGLSGSGKSIALRQLEDLGYYCIDNLPGNYLVPVAEHLHSVGRDLLAVSLDSRSDASIPEISKSFKTLKEHNVDIRVLCLTASTDALVQRYSETRRQHPLSQRSASGPETLVEAIEKERKMLEPFVGFSHIIDTTGMLPNTLNHWIRNFVRAEEGPYPPDVCVPLDLSAVFRWRATSFLTSAVCLTLTGKKIFESTPARTSR